MGEQQVEGDAESRAEDDCERQPVAERLGHARGGNDEGAERLAHGEDLGGAEADGERGDREERAQQLVRARPAAAARGRAVLLAATVLHEVAVGLGAGDDVALPDLSVVEGIDVRDPVGGLRLGGKRREGVASAVEERGGEEGDERKDREGIDPPAT